MFTGIVEGLGTIKQVTRSGGGVRMDIHSDFPLENIHIGHSISVSGACLTVVHVKDDTFKVDVSPETLSRSTLNQTKVGDRVNLERALRLGDRVDGHLVTGHIDGTGKVTAKRPAGNAMLFTFSIPEELSRYIIQKGSVAVDGISLTVNACNRGTFEVSVIPHTASVTTMRFKKVGDLVNIETDMIGKYVGHFARQAQEPANRTSLDQTVLTKAGFM